LRNVARGRPQRPPTRWEEDNRLALNPWAFLAAGLVVGGIAAVVIVFAVFV
jgi:hypothetical protein